jgi:hypothetical protein
VRRLRFCPKCETSFPTLEALLDPTSMSAGNLAELKPAPRRNPPTGGAFMNPTILADVLPQWLAEKVVDWWTVSRRQKHGRKAVWSERAFLSSLGRVVALYRVNPAKADYLAERGLEHGWQALDPQFVEGDKAYQDIPPPARPAERRPLTNPGQVVTAADAERDWPERPRAPEALPWGVNRQGPAITMSPSAKEFDQADPAQAAAARQQIQDLFKIP